MECTAALHNLPCGKDVPHVIFELCNAGPAAFGLTKAIRLDKGGITNLVKDIGSDNKNNLKVLSRILFRKEHHLCELESG